MGARGLRNEDPLGAEGDCGLRADGDNSALHARCAEGTRREGRHPHTHDVTAANNVQLDNVAKSHGQFNNSFAMQAYMPGIHQYRCCPHNYGMGWPYYAEEMWLASIDGGLCASLYGESSVRAKVGDGTTVTVTEHTDYPFDDTITLTVSTPRAVTFPLYLRVPGWCTEPSVRLGSRPVTARRSGGHLVLDRQWNDGDRVVLRLPMRTTVRTWSGNGNSVSVSHGPLDYSLCIDETWQQSGGTSTWPEYDVLPASPWNYALELDEHDPARSFALERTRARAGNPSPRPAPRCPSGPRGDAWTAGRPTTRTCRHPCSRAPLALPNLSP